MSPKLIFSPLPLLLIWNGAARTQTFEVAPVAAIQRMSHAPLGSISENEPSGDDSRFRSGHGYGVRLTWNTPGYYGHELGYMNNRIPFETKIHPEEGSPAIVVRQDRVTMHQAFYNFLIYFMPAGERWRPFITGGLQMYKYGAARIPEWPGGGARTYGANYGGGLKLKLFRHALIRFDFRDYLGGKPYNLNFPEPAGLTQMPRSGGVLHQFEGSIGIGVAF